MNCQEVMELMQRHLDRDLEDSEQDAMMAHLQQCPDCAEMFDRLQRLNDELASLPKVTPPTSLVDSILPQLEAIDRMSAAEAKETPAAAAVAPVASIDEQSQRKTKRFWSLASTGGVVAAGLLLAVIITNPGNEKLADDTAILYSTAPKQTNTFGYGGTVNSEENEIPRSNPQPEMSAGSGPAEAMPTAKQEGSETQQENPVQQKLVQPGTGEVRTEASMSKPTDNASGGQSSNAAGPQQIKPDAEPQVRDQSVSDQLPQKRSTVDGAGSAPGESSGGAAEEPPLMGALEIAPVPPQSNEKMEVFDGAPGGTNIVPPQESADAHMEDQRGFAIGDTAPSERMGIAAQPPSLDEATDQTNKGKAEFGERNDSTPEALVMVSADGRHTARLDDHTRTIRIAKTDEKQTEVFVTASWGAEEQAVLEQWEDDTHFVYTILRKDESMETFVIDLVKQTEAKQP